MPLSHDDMPFCVSAYDDWETYQKGGRSHDSNFPTRDKAKAAFDTLVEGRHFYAVAWGYRGTTGDWVDIDETIRDDD